MAHTGDPLATYNQKRDFSATPEPRGRVKTSQGRLFIVQKHAARRLHYDFRLELDGVLKSWAVTKGPSLDPADKRLAVRTEDHPFEYGGFEGVIPSGYGAGTVLLWDRGDWRPNGDPHEGMEKGVFKFTLHGERLKGGFALIRMKTRKVEKGENWLLVKERDEFADDTLDPSIAYVKSVKSGATLEEIAAGGQANDDTIDYTRGPYEALRKPAGKRASFVEPQLASLREAPPQSADWVHEIKYDGYRMIALVSGGDVRLMTRNEKDWTHRYPVVANALSRLSVEDAVIDGELVAADANGMISFSLLQNAHERPADLSYIAFDILHLNGEDLRKRPLMERKTLLRGVVGAGEGPVKYSDHILGDGTAVLSQACAMKLEGIISKKITAPYFSGRGSAWIKTKCAGNDEFVVGGYRKSDKRGRAFSSLLLGEYEDGALVYRGRVGTGFDQDAMDMLIAKMEKRARKTSPFAAVPADAQRGVVWLEPELLAQISYMEKTPDGHLRHPSFVGLREDKAATDMARTPTVVPKRQGALALIAGVRITHPDKIVYPEAEITKRLLAQYYADHGERLLPYLANRPLSIVRCPDGQGGDCFFQKHHTKAMPADIGSVDISDKKGKTSPYLMIATTPGLVAAAQIGALELHLWGARSDAFDKPERIVFDLDPDEGLPFARVRDAALEVRDVLEAAGLKTFAMLTGGKGVHVIAPLVRRRGWDDVKAFSRGFAEAMERAAPERYVSNMAKARRKGRIFVDYLRNERGSTAIAPYSTRARPGAPVATPVSWAELKEATRACAYTLATIGKRLQSLSRDPWANYFEVRQSLTRAQLAAFNTQ